MNEIFEQIFINNEPSNYYIGNNGTVKNIKTGNILKPAINRGGYHYINLSHNGKTYSVRVHRLVGLAFVNNPDNKPVINHIDGNKTNNNYTNLIWSTSSENNKHAYDIGLKQKIIGTNVHTSKLTDEIVNSICILLEYGDVTIGEISKLLDVTKSQVEGILYRGHWKHISSKFNIDFHNVKKDYGNNKKYSKIIENIIKDVLDMRYIYKLKYKEIQYKLLPLKIPKNILKQIATGKIYSEIYEKYYRYNNSSTTIETTDDGYYHININV